MKQKVLFALNYRKFEEALEQQMKNKYEFVGSASYREIIVDKVRQTNPDILIMREAIPGTKGILDIIYTIRNTHKNVRIIFMTGRREPGDLLLADLVSYGVYDIITSESIKMKEVRALIQSPNSFDDVSYLLPKPNRDESKPQKAFDVQTKVIERIVEIAPEAPIQTPPPIAMPEPIIEPEPTQIKPVPEPEPIPEPEPEPEPIVTMPTPVLPPVSQRRPPLEEALDVPKKGGFGGFKGLRRKTKDKPTPQPEPEQMALPPAPPAPVAPPVTAIPTLPPSLSGKKGRNTVIQSKQILSFVGAVNGVGNTQIAFNTAVKLSQDGHKVLFIEMNPNFSTIDTSFQLGNYQQGLDKALEALATQDQREIEKSIIRMADVQMHTKNTNAMSKNYKRMPSTLDFLFFSQDYQTLVHKPEVDYTSFKDLCMLMLMQENYDYIVVDAEPFGKQPEVAQELISVSSKVIVTLTQDTAQIGHVSRHVVELNKRINVGEKLYYILNKEVSSECDRALIEDWLDKEVTVTIPDMKHHFADASFLGIPFVLHSKDQATQQAFETLKHTIQQN